MKNAVLLLLVFVSCAAQPDLSEGKPCGVCLMSKVGQPLKETLILQ